MKWKEETEKKSERERINGVGYKKESVTKIN